ncbi:chorismate mutase [Candidatus Leptofilum sp.]|uniref:chorismate mutase n=1 Tax=Candidatus Leptofilum sp. TaxID=3241576 RepID=UPI003B5A9DFA
MKLNGLINNSSDNNPTVCRGVRGAVTVKENSEEAILAATRELLQVLVKRNEMRPEDIASVYFTTTTDLNATYPALAARQLGWADVALMCGHEMDVPGGLPMCVRVLIHWNTSRSAKEIVHVYLREAQSLRPDRQNLPPVRPRQMNAMEAMVKVMASVL